MVALAIGLASCRPPIAASPKPDDRVAVTLDDRRAVRIHVAASVMEEDRPTDPKLHLAAQRDELERRRLRESVRDLARVLHEVSGAAVTINEAGHGPSFEIRIGKEAERGEPLGVTAPYGQGFRVVVRENEALLHGETDLATSYAIYELLDRLGARWFMPGPLGEVLPGRGPLVLPRLDERRAPSTTYRAVWFADDAWRRRNREGGFRIEAGHALEAYLTDGDRAKHPEWTAIVNGKPDPARLHWSSTTLPKTLAERIVETYRRYRSPSLSISPNDGAVFDDSAEDQALDAGDFDPTMGMTSLTDRYLVLANRVAAHVAEEEPKLALGFLAYVQYTRPPVREKLHPNLVPQIAPITYSRAHPMSDSRVPGNTELRTVIDRWGRIAPTGTSIYFYGYFLSELVAPNPMLTKWGYDVPYVLEHHARYWQPETLPNFDTSMHALYMGMKVAFDSRLKPNDVYADIDAKFYGAAGAAMHAYWREVDRLWVDIPEYSGGGFGHLRRFTPERLAHLRHLLDVAKAAARTEMERRRVEIADDSLALFVRQMELRRDLAEGRFRGLSGRGDSYRKQLAALGEKHKESYAFNQTSYAPDTISANYYDAFMKPAFDVVSRIADEEAVSSVTTSFRWRAERSTVDYSVPHTAFADASWRTTNVAVDSWSALGLHDFLGAMWYRARITRPQARAPNTRSYLTLTAVDGSVHVFLNGNEAVYAPAAGDPKTPTGVGGPLRFDVTSLVVDGENVLAIVVKREAINELGVGGLLGPVVLSDAPARR